MSSKCQSGAGQEHGQDDGSDLEGMAYEPSVNQVRHESIPASHEDAKDQESVVQNEEHARRSASHADSPGHDQVAPSAKPRGRRGSRRASGS